MKVQPGGMGDLRRAVKEFRKVERVRDEEIFRAHRAGSSLRSISLAFDDRFQDRSRVI